MTNKRFTIESTATELELYDKGKQIGEFTHHEWVARSVDYVVDLLNSLYDENEQLRKELDTFKPVMFQDVRKGTVILYSKGDSNE